jgi:hypothetical protein
MEQIQSALISLAIAVITAAGGFLLAWLKAKTTEVQARAQNETEQKYIYMLSDVVQTTVTSLNQTVVEQLKKANEDGKLTKEDMENIKNSCVDTVKGVIGDKGMAVLHDALGDAEQYIRDKIEQSVVLNKRE